MQTISFCVIRSHHQNGVSENDWAQVLGHERGFTYERYSPHGITLERKAEMIGLIEYPELDLPSYR